MLILTFERLAFLKRTAVDPLASHKSPLTAPVDVLTAYVWLWSRGRSRCSGCDKSANAHCPQPITGLDAGGPAGPY
jgi:hypothetical protein